MRLAQLASGWVFVDTSALAPFFMVRDQRHQDALTVAAGVGRSGAALLTTNLVIAETHALVLSREGRAMAREALRQIDMDITVVHVSEEDERAGRAIIDRYADKDFSLTDAVSFAVMDRLKLRTTFAFDRHLAQSNLDVLTAE